MNPTLPAVTPTAVPVPVLFAPIAADLEAVERILRACRGPAASAERTSKDVEKALAQKANAPLREGRGIGA